MSGSASSAPAETSAECLDGRYPALGFAPVNTHREVTTLFTLVWANGGHVIKVQPSYLTIWHRFLHPHTPQ